MVVRAMRWIKRLIKPPVVVGRASHSCPTMRLGSEYGGWNFNPELLSKDSVVYSAGIGEDTSWDEALIARYGLTVHGFDPTPKSIRWVKARTMPRGFVLHEFGIAPTDGELIFHAPENPEHVSVSVVERKTQTQRIVLPVRELVGIMKELGHDHIDLLKMDIEGSEYGVIEDLLARKVPVRQLLVEYHHRFQGVGDAKTQASIDLLERNGYKLFKISKSAEEYSFLRV
ncbi:MAG: FkbM family methyltransferase [Planctomycetota bacterium]